uniref:ANF_receptor domain-containing protein n=1 Tax=Angiostrongylus cantonensis TaxID=6313 RepID=A0A0K0CYQ6_ANGCA
MLEQERVIALIGGSHSLLNAQLERLTDQLDIPLLTVSDDVEPSARNTKITFFPRAQLLEAIVDLFRYWRWNRITLVYEEDDRIRRFEPLLTADTFSHIRFQVIKVQRGDYMTAAREALKMGLINLKHWFLLTNMVSLEKI